MPATGSLCKRVFEFLAKPGCFKYSRQIPNFGFKVFETVVHRVDGLPTVGHGVTGRAGSTVDFESNDRLECFNRMDGLAVTQLRDVDSMETRINVVNQHLNP